MALDTDLPDFTDVMVSVARSFSEENSSDEYSLEYFSEKSTVGRWRQSREVGVSHETFRTMMLERQRKLSQAGIAGKIKLIDGDIVVSFTVPINQTNHLFGTGNSNLTGTAVTTTGSWRIVKAEASVSYPLDGRAASVPEWGNWDDLSKGRTYRLSRETPLMPALDPADPLAAIAQRKVIPTNGLISVEDVSVKGGDRWYHVTAHGSAGTIGRGWVNSVALMGQQLQVVPSGR